MRRCEQGLPAGLGRRRNASLILLSGSPELQGGFPTSGESPPLQYLVDAALIGPEMGCDCVLVLPPPVAEPDLDSIVKSEGMLGIFGHFHGILPLK